MAQGLLFLRHDIMLMSIRDFGKTIAAVATGRSASGIGVIRISGSEAISIADRVFTSINGVRLEDTPGYHAHFGKVHDAETHGDGWNDDAVALVFRAPKSYTGEDVVELSCHGGSASTELTLAACIEAGAYPAGAGEFTRRALENGKISLTQAEAVMSVISAEGRQAAAIAGSVLDGKLKKRISEVIDVLKELVVRISAWCDYPDEDEVPEITREMLLEKLGYIAPELKKITDEGKSAVMLENGIETVICGKPNVGKSTLMNLLAGREKSIVTDIAGTTRDIIDERVSLDGVILHIYDTAGIHETDSVIENIGVERAEEKIDQASLVLFMLDASRPIDDDDRRLMQKIHNKNCIGIINKSDIAEIAHNSINNTNIRWVDMSAREGHGIDELAAAVKEITGIEKLDPSAGNVINERQLACARRAYESTAEALENTIAGVTFDAVNVLLYDALDALYEMTGDKVTETVISEIFAKFCVGK